MLTSIDELTRRAVLKGTSPTAQPAARFQNTHLEAARRQRLRGGQAGQSAADNQNLLGHGQAFWTRDMFHPKRVGIARKTSWIFCQRLSRMRSLNTSKSRAAILLSKPR